MNNYEEEFEQMINRLKQKKRIRIIQCGKSL